MDSNTSTTGIKLRQGDREERGRLGSESDDSSDRSSASSHKLLSSSDDDEDLPTSLSNIWASIQETMTSLRQLASTVRLAGSKHREERIQWFLNFDHNKQVYEVFEKFSRQSIDYMFPKASETLRKRIAASIATRRIRFFYLELHQKKTSPHNEPPRQGENEDEVLPETQAGQEQKVWHMLPHEHNRDMSLQPSVILSDTLVTKLDPKQLDHSMDKEKRAESVTSVKISTGKFPPIPKKDPGGSFTCPYCFLILPTKEISGQKEWM